MKNLSHSLGRLALFGILTLFGMMMACSSSSNEEPVGAEEQAQTTFRLPQEGSCEADGMRKVANEATVDELDLDASLTRATSQKIVAGRPFATLASLDAISGVGNAALKNIYDHAKSLGYLDTCSSSGNPGEIGVLSDLDDTVIPPSTPDLDAAPYPGVATLYDILEHRNNGQDGDVYYVTARGPDRVVDVPEYLADHGVPKGSIDTGVSGVPSVARAEKIRDAKRILDRTGAQKFVLFGDTSHVDPEVYKSLLSSHGDRVAAVFIHKVNAMVNPARVEGMHLHESYAEVAAILYEKSILTKAEALRVMHTAQDEGLALTDAQISDLLATHHP